MAYTNSTQRSFSGNNKSAPAAKQQSEKRESNSLYSTGLFKPEKDGPTLASVKVKETITIPAGSYINLFAADDNDHGIVFRLQVREVAAK